MKRNYRNYVMLLSAGVILIMQACQKDDQFSLVPDNGKFSKSGLKANTVNTFYSPTLPVGKGIGRAWVTENSAGEPVSVGVNLSEKALENLPVEHTDYVFILPKNKGENFYTHVLLNWNPQGHFPDHVYDVPHFDVHFYIIPNEERMAIEADDFTEFANAPSSQYVPDYYFQIPGGEPQMGAHWADLLSPELTPEDDGTFTKTFIWGSYDGKFIFWEPMITRAYLLSHPDEIIPLRQPDAYQQDGYYATHYKVSYSLSPKEYSISLQNLVYHDGE